MFQKQLKSAFLVFLLLTVITGIIYPFVITAVAQIFFRHQADGSIIFKDGKPIGSSLIGQSFEDPKYFWGRLSATSPVAFNASASSGSNLGPLNAILRQNVEARIKSLQNVNPENKSPIPVDLVTASASGLDPHISIAAAMYQVPRVARLRGISEEEVVRIVRENTQGRFLGIIGEPVVNVLQLNMALDKYRR
ncbi:MAG: potassium-transporting ATPase subunit KdpC [Sedimentisphaerales bacterium]